MRTSFPGRLSPSFTLALAAPLFTAACSSAPPPPPVVARAPTPASVTPANPGGDADDPERAALERLATEPWGFKRDRFDTLHVPMVDWPHWQRVKLYGYPTRATFRFGDEHYAIISIAYVPINGDNDPDTCLAKILGETIPAAEAYGVHVGDTKLIHLDQHIDNEERPMLIKVMEGNVDSIVESNDYVGAVAAYSSWPGTCLLQGLAVVATHHRDLAVKVRDRWVAEGLPKLNWEKRVVEAPPTTDVR